MKISVDIKFVMPSSNKFVLVKVFKIKFVRMKMFHEIDRNILFVLIGTTLYCFASKFIRKK